MGKYRIAVDVGGTFTDVFIFDEETGDIRVTKTPSIPANPGQGILNGLDEANVPLSEVTLFSHGTTVGLNALITRNLPPTAMVTTKGFRDVIEIRRSTKPDLWDAYKDVAPPYIRRRDRLEVEERMDCAGNQVTPLNEEEARKLLAEENTPPENMQLLRFLDMRYIGQWRSLSVPVSGPITSLEEAIETFHNEHQREYAFANREQGVQIYGLHVAAVGLVPKPDLKKYPKGGSAEQALSGVRQVYFEEAGGFVEAKIYDRAKIPAGATLKGPAIVEQLDSTVVIAPGVKAEVDEYLNIIMHIRDRG
ncbi:MAG: hydantoinase/oxoprolinase N-terminal domain-containing protein [Carboxydocellales bacterium]